MKSNMSAYGNCVQFLALTGWFCEILYAIILLSNVRGVTSGLNGLLTDTTSFVFII